MFPATWSISNIKVAHKSDVSACGSENDKEEINFLLCMITSNHRIKDFIK